MVRSERVFWGNGRLLRFSDSPPYFRASRGLIISRSRPGCGPLLSHFPLGVPAVDGRAASQLGSGDHGSMKNRRVFLLTMIAGAVALVVVAAPVIADELFGVITKVDVEGKKLTIVEKGTDKEVIVTVSDDTEAVGKK